MVPSHHPQSHRQGPHTSNLIFTVTAFYLTEILEHSLRGCSIVLTVEDTIHFFGNLLRISCFASAEQQTCKPRLICNSSDSPDAVTPLINAS